MIPFWVTLTLLLVACDGAYSPNQQGKRQPRKYNPQFQDRNPQTYDNSYHIQSNVKLPRPTDPIWGDPLHYYQSFAKFIDKDDFPVPEFPEGSWNNSESANRATKKVRNNQDGGFSSESDDRNINFGNAHIIFNAILNSNYDFFSIKVDLGCPPKHEAFINYCDIKEVLSNYSVLRISLTGNKIFSNENRRTKLSQKTWILNIHEIRRLSKIHSVPYISISPRKGKMLSQIHGFDWENFFSQSIPSKTLLNCEQISEIEQFFSKLLILKKPLVVERGVLDILSFLKLALSDAELPSDQVEFCAFIKGKNIKFYDIGTVESVKNSSSLSIDVESERIGKKFFEKAYSVATEFFLFNPYLSFKLDGQTQVFCLKKSFIVGDEKEDDQIILNDPMDVEVGTETTIANNPTEILTDPFSNLSIKEDIVQHPRQPQSYANALIDIRKPITKGTPPPPVSNLNNTSSSISSRTSTLNNNNIGKGRKINRPYRNY